MKLTLRQSLERIISEAEIERDFEAIREIAQDALAATEEGTPESQDRRAILCAKAMEYLESAAELTSAQVRQRNINAEVSDLQDDTDACARALWDAFGGSGDARATLALAKLLAGRG